MPAEDSIDLRPDGLLRLREGACLPLRSAFGRCRACADVCPVQALKVEIERLSVSDACVGCGRCVAACPNEALEIDGLEPLGAATQPATEMVVRLECSRVPHDENRPETVRVPCLGAVSAGWLVHLQVHAGDRPVQVIDRGWCATCPAGGQTQHPAQTAIDKAAFWMSNLDCGDRLPALPQLRTERLAPQRAQPLRLPPRNELDPTPISRRQFFRTLASHPTGPKRHAAPMGADGQAAFPASARRPSPERARLLAALDRAARDAGAEVPAEFFPRLTQTGACVDHRVCVGACPTGALSVADAGDATRLRFNAETCIACGACVRACPEGALQLDAHGGGARQAQVIAEHERRTCESCGETFAARERVTLCPTCIKTQRFIGDAMTRLFGARN